MMHIIDVGDWFRLIKFFFYSLVKFLLIFGKPLRLFFANHHFLFMFFLSLFFILYSIMFTLIYRKQLISNEFVFFLCSKTDAQFISKQYNTFLSSSQGNCLMFKILTIYNFQLTLYLFSLAKKSVWG